MIEGNLPLMIIVQLVLIALNAIFASAEIAVISLTGPKLDKLVSDGDKRAKRLQKLTKEPARFLATIQVAITLSGFLGSAFAADNFADPLVKWLLSLGVKMSASTLNAIAVVAITLVLSYFTLIFGELVPKRIAMRKAESLALGISRTVGFISKLFAPIVWLLTKSTNLVLRMIGIDPNDEDNDVSEEDIRAMVDSGAKSGSIENEERDFIQNVFEFDDLDAGEIATHRTEVSLLWLDETDEEWSETIHNSCHNFYPVCDESVDNVVGVLYLKDYFRLASRDRKSVMKAAVKSPYFVPENVKADVLFRNMKDGHKSFAVVLDEYGGMRGIVTMNDLIGRLVGNLGDETNDSQKAQPSLEKLDSQTWKLTGSVPLDDIAKELNLELPSDDFDTFSGLVFSELGTIPDDGSTFEVDVSGMHIKVTSVREHQIESAIICRLVPESDDTSDVE